MIAKDESLFVVMNALNQFRRGCRTEKLFSHSHDGTGKVAGSFSNTERFGYISLLHLFNDDTIFLVIISDHIPAINVSMTTSQCQPHLC